MAGHSHAANIKYRKDRQDQKRGRLFSKLSQKITQAAQKDANTETNSDLRSAVDKAKEADMPKENIKRAIKRAKDNQEKGKRQVYEAVRGQVGYLIKVKTDNKNRILNQLREVLGASGASLGKSRWMFDENLEPKYPLQLDESKGEEVKALTKELKDIPEVEKVISNFKF